jgi:hypothetical protein
MRGSRRGVPAMRDAADAVPISARPEVFGDQPRRTT